MKEGFLIGGGLITMGVLLQVAMGLIRKRSSACMILLVSFICLQICWWGINYLPSARGLSIHTYNVR